MIRSTDIARARKLMASAAIRGKRDWRKLEAKIASCHAQLWDCGDAMFITEVTIDNKCNVAVAGGTNAREWIKVVETTLKDWSIQHGCTAMTLWGRRGWKKLLPHWREVDFPGANLGDLVFLELSYEK